MYIYILFFFFFFSDSDVLSCPSWGNTSVLLNSEDVLEWRTWQACNVGKVRIVNTQKIKLNIHKEEPA